jgi:hypothetical protein
MRASIREHLGRLLVDGGAPEEIGIDLAPKPDGVREHGADHALTSVGDLVAR